MDAGRGHPQYRPGKEHHLLHKWTTMNCHGRRRMNAQAPARLSFSSNLFASGGLGRCGQLLAMTRSGSSTLQLCIKSFHNWLNLKLFHNVSQEWFGRTDSRSINLKSMTLAMSCSTINRPETVHFLSWFDLLFNLARLHHRPKRNQILRPTSW